MRIRKKKWIDEELEGSQIYIKANDLKKVLKEKVKNNSFEKIEMEIGVGKGSFISKIASNNPNTLYIGADVAGTMLGISNKNIRETYEADNLELDNIILVNLNAEYILEAFLGLKLEDVYGSYNLNKLESDENTNKEIIPEKDNIDSNQKIDIDIDIDIENSLYREDLWEDTEDEVLKNEERETNIIDLEKEKAEDEVDEKRKTILLMPVDEEIKLDRIYLNFSNPWPKERHKKRRLTHPRQLLQYMKIMKDSSDIFFKTDDKDFFEESLVYISNINKFSFKYKKDFEKYITSNKEEFLAKIEAQIEKIDKVQTEEEALSLILPEIYIRRITYDLKKEDIFYKRLGKIEENIETEHEKEFTKDGKKICACIINRRK